MRFVFLFAIILILLSAGMILAEENEPNWCYEGQVWGDGRCNHPDPNINDYNWRMGWLMAHCELGLLPVEACYAPDDNDDDDNSSPPSYFWGGYGVYSIGSGEVVVTPPSYYIGSTD